MLHVIVEKNYRFVLIVAVALPFPRRPLGSATLCLS